MHKSIVILFLFFLSAPVFSQSKQSSTAKAIVSFSFTERITDSQGSSPMKGICKVEVYENDVVTIAGKRGDKDAFKYVFAFKSAYYATGYLGNVIGLCSGANLDGKTIALTLRNSDLHVQSNYTDSGVDRYFDYYKDGTVTQNDDANSYDFITLGQHLESKGILTYIDLDEIGSSSDYDDWDWDAWDAYYYEATSPFKFRSTCTVEDLLRSPLGMGVNAWGTDLISLKKEIERCTQWEVGGDSDAIAVRPTSLKCGDCSVFSYCFSSGGHDASWYRLTGTRRAIMDLTQEITNFFKKSGFTLTNDSKIAADEVLFEKDAYSQTTHYKVAAFRNSGEVEYEFFLLIQHTKSWKAGQL